MFGVIYIRVSTQDQTQGYSLEFQQDVCEEYAKRHKINIAKTFVEEGISGRSIEKRTSFKKMINYVKGNNNIEAIIVWKYDRFSRNLQDSLNVSAQLKRLGAKLHSATESYDAESPDGRFQRNINFAMSEYESDKIRERAVAGMKKALSKGYWVFSPPYGYRYGKKVNGHRKLEPVWEEAQAVKTIFEMFERHESAQEIIRVLKTLGHGKFTRSHVHKIVQNPIYCGLMRTRLFPELLLGNFKPIICKSTWFRVNGVRVTKPQVAHRSRKFLFNSFLKCNNEHVMSGYKVKGHTYYKCHESCVNIGEKKIVKQLKEMLDDELSFNKAQWQQLKEELASLAEEYSQDSKKDTTRIRARLSKLQGQEERLDELLIDGTFSKEKYKQKINKISKEKLELQAQLTKMSNKILDINPILTFAEQFLSNLFLSWQEASVDGKLAIQEFLFPEGLKILENKTVLTSLSPLIFTFKDNISPISYSMARLHKQKSNYAYEIFRELHTISVLYKIIF